MSMVINTYLYKSDLIYVCLYIHMDKSNLSTRYFLQIFLLLLFVNWKLYKFYIYHTFRNWKQHKLLPPRCLRVFWVANVIKW